MVPLEIVTTPRTRLGELSIKKASLSSPFPEIVSLNPYNSDYTQKEGGFSSIPASAGPESMKDSDQSGPEVDSKAASLKV